MDRGDRSRDTDNLVSNDVCFLIYVLNHQLTYIRCEWGVWILIAVLAKNLIEYVRVTSILRHNKILAIALPVQFLSAVILYNLCWESKYQYFRYENDVFT